MSADRDRDGQRKAGSDVPSRDVEKTVEKAGSDQRGEPNSRITNTRGYKGSHRKK